jgi:hypothetical protein
VDCYYQPRVALVDYYYQQPMRSRRLLFVSHNHQLVVFKKSFLEWCCFSATFVFVE